MSNYNYAKYPKKPQEIETLNPKILDEKIKSKKIGGFYCLFGDEDYMIDYYIKKILDELNPGDFDRAVFDADNFDLEQFRDIVSSYPVMSDFKIAVVKNAGDIKFKSGEKDDFIRIMSDFKDEIKDYCCIIFKMKNLTESPGKKVGRDDPGAPGSKTSENQIHGAPGSRTGENQIHGAPGSRTGENQIHGAPGSSRPTETKKTPKSNFSLAAFLKENADLFEFKENPAASLIKWLKKIAASENCVLSDENAGLILSRTEPKMYPLKNELDKLIRFTQADGRDTITSRDVELLVPKKTELEAFELTNAILDKKYGKAVESLEKLRSLKEEPVLILGQIARYFSDLAQVNAALASGTADSFAISKKTGIHEYKVKLTVNSLRKHKSPGEFIKKSLDLCRECDVKLKSTALPEYGLLENLLFNIAEV